MLRTKYGDFRRKLFAQFTSSWLEGEIAKLRKECVYSFIPPKKKEETIFSVREKQLIKVVGVDLSALVVSGSFFAVLLWVTPCHCYICDGGILDSIGDVENASER